MQLATPIYISWDDIVDRDEELRQAALDGIQSVLRYIPGDADVRFYGPGPWSQGDFSGVEWYLDQSRLDNGQTDGNRLVELHYAEPWQRTERHTDFVLIGRDLTARQGSQLLNFVFGLTSGPVSIQSVHRFVHYATDREAALASARLIAAHEFGHVVGLVPGHRPNHDSRPGLYQGHCTQLCVMQQVMSVPESERLATRLATTNTDFCSQCVSYLRERYG